MRKKIVKIFAAALGLEGYWITKKLFTDDEKKARRKIASKKFQYSDKGKKRKFEYRLSERCKQLRRENYAKNKSPLQFGGSSDY